MAAAAESIGSRMTDEERERADAIMRGWFAFNVEALELETACNKVLDSIGRKAADVIAEEIGVDHDLIGGRNEEFGRLLADAVRTYVQAARALGLSHARILFGHILPNVFHIVIVTFTLEPSPRNFSTTIAKRRYWIFLRMQSARYWTTEICG